MYSARVDIYATGYLEKYFTFAVHPHKSNTKNMGTFKIEITAVGGHGQDREKKDGEFVDFNAGGESTPDAIAKKLVDELKASGANVESAKIIHWPGQESEVTDDLMTGLRKGNF